MAQATDCWRSVATNWRLQFGAELSRYTSTYTQTNAEKNEKKINK